MSKLAVDVEDADQALKVQVVQNRLSLPTHLVRLYSDAPFCSIKTYLNVLLHAHVFCTKTTPRVSQLSLHADQIKVCHLRRFRCAYSHDPPETT